MLSARSISPALGLIFAMFAGSAIAQPATEVTPPAPPAATSPPLSASVEAARKVATQVSPAEFAARSLFRYGVVELGMQRARDPSDYRLAEMMLSVAGDLEPRNEDLLRWRIAIAASGEDLELLEKLTRRLVVLDPKDTVAQLRLVRLTISHLQTAEDRLAAYERLLGPAGKSLDPSVRSRLALDAAQLYRERGDDQKFATRLSEATSLDSTNREAAALALAYFVQRVDDPAGRMDLLGNLLQADPLDADTWLAISRELAASGAYEEARKVQKNILRLVESAGAQPPQVLIFEMSMGEWVLDGAKKTVDELNGRIVTYRKLAGEQIKQAEQLLMPTELLTKPEDVRLEPASERVRLIAALECGDQETIKESAKDLRATVTARQAELADPKKRPANMPPDKAEELGRAMGLNLIEVLAWAGVDIDRIEADLASVVAKYQVLPDDKDYLSALGWVLLRTGKAEEAIKILEPLAAELPAAHAALGQAYAAAGRTADALKSFQRIIDLSPFSLEGVVSYERQLAINEGKPANPARLEKAKRFFASLPSYFDQLVSGGASYTSLIAENLSIGSSPLKRSQVRLMLRNAAPVPLGVGADRSIRSRIILGSRTEVNQSSLPPVGVPGTVDLARRLRLMPNEFVEAMVWPDPDVNGLVVELYCRATVRQRFRAVQGAVQDGRGAFVPGPFCWSVETASVVHSPLPEAFLTPAELTSLLAQGPDDRLAAVVAAIRSLYFKPANPNPPADDDSKAFAAAAALRYTRGDASVKQILLTTLPTAAVVPAFAALDEVAKQETDSTLLPLVIITRIADAADPLLLAAKGSPDTRIADAARLHAARLTAGKKCVARNGLDLSGGAQDLITDAPDEAIAAPAR